MPADLTLRPTLYGLPDIPAEGEKELLGRMIQKLRREASPLKKLGNYYRGEQRLQHLGLAIPPALRIFETVVGVPAVAVDEVVKRQELRGFFRRGRSVAEDPELSEAADYNNLGSQAVMLQTDQRMYGRGFVSVSTNPDDEDEPLILVESPLNLTVAVDRVRRKITAACRHYVDDVWGKQRATLYTPTATSHWKLGEAGQGWILDSDYPRDQHNLGVVPLIMFLNKQTSGSFDGRSEMAPVITKTDAIARMVTNMQVGGETHALPHYWAAGMTMSDFKDPKTKKQLPQWESYFTSIWATEKETARFGQFSASDLSNFYNAVDKMLSWCAFELGLPVSYVGQTTTNPATEGAIIADEIRLIRNVELKNRFDGDAWVWVMGLRQLFLGQEPDARNDIRAVYFNPATPTFSQRADAVTKLRATKDISRRGMWDELGWDADRQAQELQRLQEERDEEQQQDQLLQTIAKGFAARQATAGQPPQVIDQQQPAQRQLTPADQGSGTA